MATSRDITIVCYGKTKTYPESQRKALIAEFREGVDCCDGCERERYMNIMLDLMDGKKLCKDERY